MVNDENGGALEWLMTYGWAILIIIVVVAALYSLGVFSEIIPAILESRAIRSLLIAIIIVIIILIIIYLIVMR